jgi:ArsR family transcriptional regulator, arsenate/arsenite/antimonite-responsive transcriptional repressor
MGASVWKALSDDSRRQMLLLLRNKDMFPSELAEHFELTLAGVSTHLRILRDADLVKEKREGQRRLYSLNTETTLEIKSFFDQMWSRNLGSLKEFVENKKRKQDKRR